MYDKKIIYGLISFTVITFFLYAIYKLGWFYKGISLLITSPSVVPPGEWRTSNIGTCSATACGKKGIQEKQVQCYDPKTGLGIDSSNCNQATKPGDTESCSAPPCGEWVAGNWDKECPVCGPQSEVTRNRTVTCPDGSICDISTKPTDTNVCYGIDLCKWVMSDWDVPCPDCNPPPNVMQKRTLIGCQSGNNADCVGTPPASANICPRRDCVWKTGDWVSSNSVPPPIV